MINIGFFFVHSYHVKCEDISDVMFTTNYGYEFHSGINKEKYIWSPISS